MSQFLFKWIFLLSIELIHNLEHVQIVKMGQLFFCPQKLTLWVSFWAQKLTHALDSV